MESITGIRRLAGGGLMVGAAGFALSGVLHPTSSAEPVRAARIEILQDANWAYPHWIALVTMLLLAVTAWLLVDAGVTRGSTAAHVGGRITVLASLVMAVQGAAEVAAPSSLDALVADEPAPLVDLISTVQAVGWPAFAAGWILVAVGCGRRLAPRPVVALAVAGAAALALGGVLVEGLGVVPAAPLFSFGGLVALWLLWAGVRLVRDTSDAMAGSEVAKAMAA
jgi:hypothetical protein